jgi:hypothetical protein
MSTENNRKQIKDNAPNVALMALVAFGLSLRRQFTGLRFSARIVIVLVSCCFQSANRLLFEDEEKDVLRRMSIEAEDINGEVAKRVASLVFLMRETRQE